MFKTHREKYSLRKLSVGLASILIGISFIQTNSQTASADTVDSKVNSINHVISNYNQDVKTQDIKIKQANVDIDKVQDVKFEQSNTQTANSSELQNNEQGNLNNQTNQDQATQVAPLQDSKHQPALDKASNDNNLVQKENAETNKTSDLTKTQVALRQAEITNKDIVKTANANQVSTETIASEGKQDQDNVSKTPWYTKQEALDIAKENIANDSLDEGSELEKSGGLNPNVWGTFNIDDWDVAPITVKQPRNDRSVTGVTLTGYHGDKDHIILPDSDSVRKVHSELFKNVDSNNVYITSDFVHKLIMDNNPITFAIRGDGSSLENADTNWSWAFARTNDKKTLLGDSRLTKVNIKNLFWADTGVAHLDHMFDGDHIDTIANIDFMSMYNHEFDANGDTLPITASAMFKGNNLKQLAGLLYDDTTGVVTVDNSDSSFDSFMENVSDTRDMFADNQLYSLNGLISSGIGSAFYKGIVADRMFINNHLTDLSNDEFLTQTNFSSAVSMFENNSISKLPNQLYLGEDQITPNVNLSYMFNKNNLTKLPQVDWVVHPDEQIKSLNLAGMFANNEISDVSKAANWTEMVQQSVKQAFGAINLSEFLENNQVSDLSGFQDWNTSTTVSMAAMFKHNKIVNTDPISNWNVSELTDAHDLFYDNQIVNPVLYWAKNKITNMSGMFSGNPIKYANLTDWNLDNAEKLGDFIKTDNNAIVITKDNDLEKLTNASVNSDNEAVPVINTKPNQLHFGAATIAMPTVYVADDKDSARSAILNTINSKIEAYQKQNPAAIITQVIGLDSLIDLANLANAKFNVDVKTTINYVDETGKVIKTDKITDLQGNNIKLEIPDGYHIDGDVPKLTISGSAPVKTVKIIQNKYDTGIPETISKDVLNIINYVDESGKTVKIDHVTGKNGDSIIVTIPKGYHINGAIPKLVIDSHEPVKNINVTYNKHETGNPLVNDKPSYDINTLKKHETGNPLVNDKPSYDINKLKERDTGNISETDNLDELNSINNMSDDTTNSKIKITNVAVYDKESNKIPVNQFDKLQVSKRIKLNSTFTLTDLAQDNFVNYRAITGKPLVIYHRDFVCKSKLSMQHNAHKLPQTGSKNTLGLSLLGLVLFLGSSLELVKRKE